LVDGYDPIRPHRAAGAKPHVPLAIFQAESHEALAKVLEGHLHLAMGGSVETLEFLSMPGM
jgi:hypothetical protein